MPSRHPLRAPRPVRDTAQPAAPLGTATGPVTGAEAYAAHRFNGMTATTYGEPSSGRRGLIKGPTHDADNGSTGLTGGHLSDRPTRVGGYSEMSGQEAHGFRQQFQDDFSRLPAAEQAKWGQSSASPGGLSRSASGYADAQRQQEGGGNWLQGQIDARTQPGSGGSPDRPRGNAVYDPERNRPTGQAIDADAGGVPRGGSAQTVPPVASSPASKPFTDAGFDSSNPFGGPSQPLTLQNTSPSAGAKSSAPPAAAATPAGGANPSAGAPLPDANGPRVDGAAAGGGFGKVSQSVAPMTVKPGESLSINGGAAVENVTAVQGVAGKYGGGVGFTQQLSPDAPSSITGEGGRPFVGQDAAAATLRRTGAAQAAMVQQPTDQVQASNPAPGAMMASNAPAKRLLPDDSEPGSTQAFPVKKSPYKIGQGYA